MADKRPIIVIKKKGGHGGHHGGAWKVAYADFVTAMMSLFIVLWLLNSTPQVKKAVAGYFNDPSGTGASTGTGSKGAGESLSIDQTNVEKLKDEIQNAMLKQTDLSKLSKNVEITMTGEGLRIELIEGAGGTFFQSGSSQPSEDGVKLLDMLAGQLDKLPNRVMIEGHTDAQPYAGENGYSNWELSADRANAARRVLQENGVGPEQISQVRGYAAEKLKVPGDPLDPSNRRVSLIVQWEPTPVVAAPAAAAEGAGGGKGEAKEGAAAGEVKKGEPAAGEAKAGAGAAAAGGAAPVAAAAGKADLKPMVAAPDLAVGKAVAMPAAAEQAPAAVASGAVAKGKWMDRLGGMLPAKMKAMLPGKKKP
jgi:chemotaxis protein MotB